jgi:hypothetical protein
VPQTASPQTACRYLRRPNLLVTSVRKVGGREHEAGYRQEDSHAFPNNPVSLRRREQDAKNQYAHQEDEKYDNQRNKARVSFSRQSVGG